jgi:chemotaxis protein CheX
VILSTTERPFCGRFYFIIFRREAIGVRANLINPFLAASVQVIETLISVKPVVGKLEIMEIHQLKDHVWLKIGITGHIQNEILFGFQEKMAIKMVARMMGGYPILELDDLCRSGVAELGNMISGNASTMLYDDGQPVDITPPRFVSEMAAYWGKKAFRIPLSIDAVGVFNIHIVV